MKTIELFSGTQSFSKVARELGHETFCVDSNPKFDNDLTIDLKDIIKKCPHHTQNEKTNSRNNIRNSINWVKLWKRIGEADIVWMSPPCTTFSMASGNTHWNDDRSPKTEDAKMGRELLKSCWIIAKYCIKEKKIFFIENPRARARWFLPKEYRKTAWYCQYGDKRAKPTDIWTNLEWTPKICHNYIKGQPKHCHHEPSPRGSKTGTQGLKGSMERGCIPPALFIEIFKQIKVTKVKEKKK